MVTEIVVKLKIASGYASHFETPAARRLLCERLEKRIADTIPGVEKAYVIETVDA